MKNVLVAFKGWSLGQEVQSWLERH